MYAGRSKCRKADSADGASPYSAHSGEHGQAVDLAAGRLDSGAMVEKRYGKPDPGQARHYTVDGSDAPLD